MNNALLTDQERLNAFRAALDAASREYGVRIAIVRQVGNVVLDEPALGYVLLVERAAVLPSQAGEEVFAGLLQSPLADFGEAVESDDRRQA